ncbi:hypothetical protein OCH239_08780 [Roseivivax halodurans JCM 10272]|uniref:CsbD-like domain-containing protein n=1 Tax=Roseivivax halodurans JCM 10272 TaxID=1449350 RepID=X7EJF1_9RHOB|nr:CsbD family protein [Roseivivax halodurans]ETX16239.1 hypothetical protein OCH239_08780 [Roseivivax halodurans JCM 10272]
MNWDQAEGKWDQLKGEAQKQWGKLTGDDVEQAKGNREQLAGKLQERYGHSKEEAQREVDDWIARH